MNAEAGFGWGILIGIIILVCSSVYAAIDKEGYKIESYEWKSNCTQAVNYTCVKIVPWGSNITVKVCKDADDCNKTCGKE